MLPRELTKQQKLRVCISLSFYHLHPHFWCTLDTKVIRGEFLTTNPCIKAFFSVARSELLLLCSFHYVPLISSPSLLLLVRFKSMEWVKKSYYSFLSLNFLIITLIIIWAIQDLRWMEKFAYHLCRLPLQWSLKITGLSASSSRSCCIGEKWKKLLIKYKGFKN